MKTLSIGQIIVGTVFYFCFLPFVLFGLLAFFPAVILNGKYAKGVLHSLDHVANAVIGRSPDHTISSGCGIRIKNGTAGWFCKTVCAVLSKLEPGHCVGSIEDNKG